MPRSFRVARDIRYRVIDDEAIVVRQSEGDILVLNEVAARVLDLVGKGLSQSKIIDRVVGEFEAPAATVSQDVERFLGELEDLNVLERLPEAGDAP